MGITPKFSSADVRRDIERQWAKIEAQLLSIIFRVGEQFVSDARRAIGIDAGAFPKGDYQDQTANLRSSIGYAVLRDGQIVKLNLEGKGKQEGMAAAMSLLGTIPKTPNGYQLIGMAGMEYASYLEAMGYNVISSQSEVALADLSKMLKAYAARRGFDMDIDANGVMVSMR